MELVELMAILSKCKECGIKEVADTLFKDSKTAGKCPDCGELLTFRVQSASERATGHSPE